MDSFALLCPYCLVCPQTMCCNYMWTVSYKMSPNLEFFFAFHKICTNNFKIKSKKTLNLDSFYSLLSTYNFNTSFIDIQDNMDTTTQMSLYLKLFFAFYKICTNNFKIKSKKTLNLDSFYSLLSTYNFNTSFVDIQDNMDTTTQMSLYLNLFFCIL